MTDIKNVAKLVTPIAEKYGADRVALFGSRAKREKLLITPFLRNK